MSDAPQFIVKKKKGHGGHHGGAWKVAYADFVTAMMALFIVLWVLGQSQEVKDSVASYFKDPAGFTDKGKGLLPGGNMNNGPSNPSQEIKAGNPGDTTGLSKEQIKKMEEQRLKAMGEEIVKVLSTNPDFSDLVDNIQIEVVDEGLRIEMVESSDDIFFEVGTASLKNKAKNLLTKIGDHLSKIPNNIVLEGHTDARPFPGNGNGYTNYELSADRANAARKALTGSRLNPHQIDEIRGYADKRLRDHKDPFNLVNRRISIIVKYGK